MKRHYDIMRMMRTKVVDSHELLNTVQSIQCLRDAIRDRVDDLASMPASPWLLGTMTDVNLHRNFFGAEARS
jgi:hypothetical protein